MAQKKKFTLFNIFNPSGDGKGVSKEELNQPRNFIFFFKMFWRNLSAILTVNMYFVLGNFPLLFTLFGMTGNLDISTNIASSPMLGPISGALDNAANPVSAALTGALGVQLNSSIQTTWTLIFLFLGLLAVFTFGPVNIGTTYLLRNIVKGEPLFIWHDFWYAIKRNLKQGLIIGIMDALMIALIIFDFLVYGINTGSVLRNIMFAAIVVVAVYYIFVRFYMYIITITFDLSIIKILKNSLIFSLLGLKRNLLALLGIVCAVILNAGAFIAIPALGIMLPIFITFSACAFMGIYAAYPKIKEYMIDPYIAENGDPEDTSPKAEPIFRDTV